MKPGRQSDVPVARMYDAPVAAMEQTDFMDHVSQVLHAVIELMPETTSGINYGKVLTHETK